MTLTHSLSRKAPLWALSCLMLLVSIPAGFGAEVTVERDMVRVTRFTEQQLEKLSRLSPQELAGLQSVVVLDENKPGDSDALPSVFGRSRLEEGILEFAPRFRFDTGQEYQYELNLEDIGEPLSLEQVFSFEADLQLPSTTVTNVFPSADVLPENLFKFYIHFSHPMSRGQAYDHIVLLDAEGRQVELPFLELGEELWNRDTDRFTLLFDPGRIKQDLRPNLELGLPLEAGKTYTLVIETTWPDSNGVALAQEFRKTFSVSDIDSDQPKPSDWRISSPRYASIEPVRVEFDEPLDNALLHSAISIQSPSGEHVSGQITVSDFESVWTFNPDQPWSAGEYQLVVKTILEDRSANSIGRAFEVIRTDGPATDKPVSVNLPFTVTP